MTFSSFCISIFSLSKSIIIGCIFFLFFLKRIIKGVDEGLTNSGHFENYLKNLNLSKIFKL